VLFDYFKHSVEKIIIIIGIYNASRQEAYLTSDQEASIELIIGGVQ
jgi:hypothetical protein